MGAADIIILAVIAVLLILSIRYMRKNGTCTENCDHCHGVCHSKDRKKDALPPFVEAYRKDHPKASK